MSHISSSSVRCGTLSKFWENKDFRDISGIGYVGDHMMIKDRFLDGKES